MDQIAQTVNDLGAVLRRSVDCRKSLELPGIDGAMVADTLALLDDLDEYAMDLVSRVRTVARGPWGEVSAPAVVWH